MSDVILPGDTVIIKNERSIYNGYECVVQRIEGQRYACLVCDKQPWEKMNVFTKSELQKKVDY
jgi:hypothetical protein